MTEKEATVAYARASERHDKNPCATTARRLRTAALEMVAISDDYQSLLDEADDILGEYA